MAYVTSRQVLKALASRHRLDVFVPEVKDGPTIFGSHSRLDALAMPISWTRQNLIGYEIKVSRSDFLRDDKWMSYLPMCNTLYFVVVQGIATPEECPEQCGMLIYYPKSGTVKLAKKAPYRQIEHPVNLYLYLIYRCIGARASYEREFPRDFRLLDSEASVDLVDYVKDKKTMKEIGRHISKKLRKDIDKVQSQIYSHEDLKCKSDKQQKLLHEIAKKVNSSYSPYSNNKDLLKVIDNLANGDLPLPLLNDIRTLQTVVASIVSSSTKEVAQKQNIDEE